MHNGTNVNGLIIRLDRIEEIKLWGDFKVDIKFNGMNFYFWLNVNGIKNNYIKDENVDL
jgi:hypothetical protein